KYDTLDSDLYDQWQRAQELWWTIQLSLIRKANKSVGLDSPCSEVANMSAALSIKIRNLLDQSYSRLIREAIFVPNGEWPGKKAGEN
ncbi:hypothetical protein ABTD73_20090, partial [Acinetobacter baumannii]